jgi:hypothetical protein
MPARAIDSKLTAMGKDERAISVSGYVHRGFGKYTDRAFEKTIIYKRHSRNHLLDQVESFRIGDRESDREDDFSTHSATHRAGAQEQRRLLIQAAIKMTGGR